MRLETAPRHHLDITSLLTFSSDIKSISVPRILANEYLKYKISLVAISLSSEKDYTEQTINCQGNSMTNPQPISNDNIAIYELVTADMVTRAEHGVKTYGTYLQAHNGRNALLDAYEEALDLSVYLKQALEEQNPTPNGFRQKYHKFVGFPYYDWDTICTEVENKHGVYEFRLWISNCANEYEYSAGFLELSIFDPRKNILPNFNVNVLEPYLRNGEYIDVYYWTDRRNLGNWSYANE